jgi:TonB family protein
MRVSFLFKTMLLAIGMAWTFACYAQTTGLEPIQQKILSVWSAPDSAKRDSYSVTLRIWMLPDGTVRDVRIETQSQMDDAEYRAFAESAKEAALKASPLPVPPTQPEDFTNGNLVLTFRGTAPR